MTVRAVVLLSGGLDSMLAIRILQLQGVEIEALNFRTTFACCQDQAALAAEELGVRLTVRSDRDDYLEVIRNPRFGYGRGANPCVDCRIYMFRLAAQWMREIGADFVASGEVVGQRPMSQKKRDLARIAHHADVPDHLLRPLSARLLPPTAPERAGMINRDALYGISGRGRSELIALARKFGLRRIPQPSTGCALTEPQFANKVFDLLDHQSAATRWEFELLKVGRHLRYDRQTKIVLGRRAEENEQLARLYGQRSESTAALLIPENFLGPSALICTTGAALDDDALSFAGGLVLRYSKADTVAGLLATLHQAGTARRLALVADAGSTAAASL